MRPLRMLALLAVLFPVGVARAGVVINEIFYNAPNDLDDVQWLELHNTADQPVDLSGWTLEKGELFVFPQGAKIESKGYLVIALKPEAFHKAYGNIDALGPMKRPLKKGGERIELADAAEARIDAVKFKDKHPWPSSADGYSASLERISPSAPAEGGENWAASPLPAGPAKPSGTPGKQNASYCAALPPVIAISSPAVDDLSPGQALAVQAEVKAGPAPREVALLYKLVEKGAEGDESAIAMTKDASGHYAATIPAQKAGTLIRYRVKAVGEPGAQRLYPDENDIRPALSTYVHDKWDAAKIPFGLIVQARPAPNGRGGPPGPRRGGGPGIFGLFSRGAQNEERPARGSAAFVYVDPKSGKTSLFDFIHTDPRKNGGGYKLHFQKDHMLNGMTTVSMIFEGNEPFLLSEYLAYDVYHRAGMPAPHAEFVRLWLDGRMIGYHLMVENPNRAFLRRNKIDDAGNLYKIRWYNQGIVGQHDKKTNAQTGHDDVIAIITKLGKTSGDEQWKLIQENFDVDEMATYFAVNMVLSHWDGFFNNYYTYHDTKKNKWQMYPWDQDKTWGFYDGVGDEVFFDMPLNFGMAGAKPPGGNGRGGGFGGFGPFGGGPMWWRPPGWFSGPLLANPQFRKVFLKKTRDILDKIYTKDVYFPLMEQLQEQLKDDVALRARIDGAPAEIGPRRLAAHIQTLQTHLLKRREFLLAQDELKAAPAPAP